MTNNKKPWWKKSPFKNNKKDNDEDRIENVEPDDNQSFNSADYTDDYRFQEKVRNNRPHPRNRSAEYGNRWDDWEPGNPVGPRPIDDDFDSIFRRPGFSFGFGDSFFTNIEREFSEMRESMDRMLKQSAQGRLDQDTGDRRSFMYGYSMRTGPDGKPQIKEWSNLPPEMMDRLRDRRALPFRVDMDDERGSSCETGSCNTCGPTGRIREIPRTRGRNTGELTNTKKPIADVLECDDHISVTLELPGVDKDEISLEVVDDVLEIAVDSPGKDYSDIIELPSRVDPDSIEATFKNGVLNVCIKLKNTKSRKGKKINIR